MSEKSNTASQIHYGTEGYHQLNQLVNGNDISSIFILVDENTQQYCLSGFLQKLETQVQTEVIEIEAGEKHKTLETCSGVWKVLSEMGADRKSLFISLGGGVVTDLGGFIASLYKRGIRFVHVPTTLLAMVDASIGGKNGANLAHLKNQIGTITPPEMILVDSTYLQTLPQNQMKSGLAEMLKHGLVYDKNYWESMRDLSQLGIEQLEDLIRKSAGIKTTIVAEDPNENSRRKILNFGHTLGHAIESYFLSNAEKTTLLHGEAIAIGMIMEAYLSHKVTNLAENDMAQIKEVIRHTFAKIDFHKNDRAPIIKLMEHDKKNVGGKINFVLLKAIGDPKIDQQVDPNLVLEAFDYYNA